MTLAMSLLIHGEAVRFNRGESRGDDFDFKYMRGRDGSVYPYVSSQCYKRFWREALPEPYSPVIREKDRTGKEKNQAFTSGNPIDFIDDDLFGYMIAGASDKEEYKEDDSDSEASIDSRLSFVAEEVKNAEAFKAKLLNGSPLSNFILSMDAEGRSRLTECSQSEQLSGEIVDLMNRAVQRNDLHSVEGIKAKRSLVSTLNTLSNEERRKVNSELLRKAFAKDLEEKSKRPTTKRTAPVRMHALVAFSGIKTAKDFQTFSRHVAYTGENSIVNPASPGIYSGWLKTRILIESDRIGKFYVGDNMDLLDSQVTGREVSREPNPYSRGDTTKYIQLDDVQRLKRFRTAIAGLADIGNRRGPASGALHDGSLKPKAFVAGFMKCADSPFDYVWRPRRDDKTPDLDLDILCDAILDWQDLFAVQKLFIGLPAEADGRFVPDPSTSDVTANSESANSELRKSIQNRLAAIGFEALVDSPRRAMLALAQEASL